jgi:hypothetical protein
MRFLLVIGFIEHLQVVTTSNYSTIANLHTLKFTTARTKSSQSAVQSLPGSGFQRQIFPLLCVTEISQRLSYQLLTATAHKD